VAATGGMAYWLATLHPDIVRDERGERDPRFFTSRADKERQIRDFYQQPQDIAVCMEHRGQGNYGFIVNKKERIGEVLDIFQGQNGQLMVKIHLDQKHPGYPALRQEQELGVVLDGPGGRSNQKADPSKKRRWGVSAGILTDWEKPLPERRIAHVAVCKVPYLAKYDTYLNYYSFNEDSIDREIVRQNLYKEGLGQCYATSVFKKKLKGTRTCGGLGSLRSPI